MLSYTNFDFSLIKKAMYWFCKDDIQELSQEQCLLVKWTSVTFLVSKWLLILFYRYKDSLTHFFHEHPIPFFSNFQIYWIAITRILHLRSFVAKWSKLEKLHVKTDCLLYKTKCNSKVKCHWRIKTLDCALLCKTVDPLILCLI